MAIQAQAEMVTVRVGLPWWRLLARDRLALCSAVWLAFLVVGVVFGPELLGKAATEALVHSFVAILVLDFFLAMFFNSLYVMIWPRA